MFSGALGPDFHDPICFSTYQRELNKLYMLASPAIEEIYHVQHSDHSQAPNDKLRRVREVTLQLWNWRSQLPENLFPRLEYDCSRTLSRSARAFYLQSLSLQLTFDSLIIVLHRPFIKQHSDPMLGATPKSSSTSINPPNAETAHLDRDPDSQLENSDVSNDSDIYSHSQWWEAAIRTSRVTGLPQLAEFATDSHLVAFLAMNLFNAAMVMVVVALSDPLTDKAQEAKRAVARIYRLQETLGARSTLSKQSSSVLRSLVQLLLRRETDAMLPPMNDIGVRDSDHDSSRPDGSNVVQVTVRDALSMPFGQDFRRTEGSKNFAQDGLASRLNRSLATVQKGGCL